MKMISAIFASVALAAPWAGAGGMPPPTVDAGYRCWHNVRYGPRRNLPDEGAGFTGEIGNWPVGGAPWRQATHKSGQDMDVYAPTNLAAASAPVVMYIHKGAWCQPFDKDCISGVLLWKLLDRGAIVCTVDYILQPDVFFNISDATRPEATFAEMLRDIDAATAKLREVLEAMGVVPSSFVLVGESAGAHLALLYAYDQGNPGPLGLGLAHALRVSKVACVAGPADLPSLDPEHGRATDSHPQDSYRRKFRTLVKRLVAGSDEIPDGEMWPLAEKWSPAGLVNSESVPTVLAYGQLLPYTPTDGAIPLAQMYLLRNRLNAAGVPCSSRTFPYCRHYEVMDKAAGWVASEVVPGVQQGGADASPD